MVTVAGRTKSSFGLCVPLFDEPGGLADRNAVKAAPCSGGAGAEVTGAVWRRLYLKLGPLVVKRGTACTMGIDTSATSGRDVLGARCKVPQVFGGGSVRSTRKSQFSERFKGLRSARGNEMRSMASAGQRCRVLCLSTSDCHDRDNAVVLRRQQCVFGGGCALSPAVAPGGRHVTSGIKTTTAHCVHAWRMRVAECARAGTAGGG
ncbi:hypothetical protein P153DRAFT_59948 [Dothidotthia symphoricarpi CBS 119687]|uniref:Uncharacterized protein n=1 Tax=Dothidotthia symphoricarpi CBS 119687 TaxID=1392245 RepID=A0A6A6A6E4_9PLEO|nr:uncharacterized protein P153DRAFT_59948 [Dothidotthia symphoricarpi CBS 119687]KAF2127126.1 hypothetical protein P153DRAFT_59948 [Dothidotthia symphoricarpi CBS 119687]